MDAISHHQPGNAYARHPDGQPVALALQGGGSHGAFAWGVLDRLLDESWLHVGAVSGASAGAMNAAMLVQGLATGGPGEARRLLLEFWRRVAEIGGSADPERAPWPWSLAGAFELLRQSSKLLPHVSMALGLNPLRGVLQSLLDPSAFGTPGAPRLMVSATRVRTGEARLFCDAQVTVDALLASACLPQLFPAVEIDGEAYWDGGYSTNPPLRPLIETGAPADVIVVKTSPLERLHPPSTANEIMARSAELGFDAPLREELRSLALAQELLGDRVNLPPPLARLRDARLHMIVAEREFHDLRAQGKLDATWSLLRRLHQLGADTADAWLQTHGSGIGRHSTADLARFATPAMEAA